MVNNVKSMLYEEVGITEIHNVVLIIPIDDEESVPQAPEHSAIVVFFTGLSLSCKRQHK
jgi:hypothetical protein